MRHIRHTENKKLNEQNPINMADLDKAMNEFMMDIDNPKDLGLIKRYLERLVLIIERSRIRDYMMLTDSKRRLFVINFIAGLGKGFGQAIGFTFLAAVAFFIVSRWVNLPIIGEYIAELINIVDMYRKGR